MLTNHHLSSYQNEPSGDPGRKPACGRFPSAIASKLASYNYIVPVSATMKTQPNPIVRAIAGIALVFSLLPGAGMRARGATAPAETTALPIPS